MSCSHSLVRPNDERNNKRQARPMSPAFFGRLILPRPERFTGRACRSVGQPSVGELPFSASSGSQDLERLPEALFISYILVRSALGSYMGFSEASAAKRSPAISIS